MLKVADAHFPGAEVESSRPQMKINKTGIGRQQRRVVCNIRPQWKLLRGTLTSRAGNEIEAAAGSLVMRPLKGISRGWTQMTLPGRPVSISS